MRSAVLRLLENDPPTILSVATALPDFRLDQREVASVALRIFDREKSEIDRLMPVFEHAGVAARHSCVPFGWYGQPHGWRERNALYLEHATRLLRDAATRALAEAGRKPVDIAGIVAVSTTGIATPSLDARMINAIGLPADVQRLPIFGLGCAGGVIGLGHGAADRAWRRAVPGGRALLPDLPPRRHVEEQHRRFRSVRRRRRGDRDRPPRLVRYALRPRRRAYLARFPRRHGLAGRG